VIKLTTTTPLGGTVARDDQIGTLRITEWPNTALASVTMRKGKSVTFRRAALDAFGAEPPAGGAGMLLGAGSASDHIAVIWMGPDQYLVETEIEAEQNASISLASRLAERFAQSASITDQSDAWVRFDIEGDDCVAMLERLSAADSRTMKPCDAVRTPIHHMGCILVCRATKTRFSIFGPRSSALSLHHALTSAAASL
jgi:sarcosine oxidase subunit gamma